MDPLPIIRQCVYGPAFGGSFSIKVVAPALLGNSLSYNGMAVANGAAAQVAFEELIAKEKPESRRAELKRAMLEYCAKDTLAMVMLVAWMAS